MSLTSLQESYIKGLRQITGAGQEKESHHSKGTEHTKTKESVKLLQKKKVASAPTERPGLGSRSKKQTGKEYAYYTRGEQLKTAFDISNKAVLASFFFWLLLMYGLYVAGGYILMALRVIWNDSDLREECQAHFSTDLQENLRLVSDYHKGEAAPYLSRFASYRPDYEDYPAESQSLPPLVTAVASSQFYLMQGFLQHIHHDLKEELKDVKLIVYDVGLYRREKEILKLYCGCEVRTVEYDLYPDHVADFSNFAWRPIVIQSVLDEFGAVVYVDVTTRFKTGKSLDLVRSRRHNHFLLWDRPSFTSTVAYTNKQTFNFLNETRCLFSDVGLIDSQVMVFYKTNTTWNGVMKPWLKCALNLNCIAPRWSRLDGCLHFRRPKTTGCHTYDLSALSIVLNRAMQVTTAGHTNHYIPPRFVYVSSDEPSLFQEQPWTNTQLMILLLIPTVFCIIIFRKQIRRCLSGTILKDNKKDVTNEIKMAQDLFH